MSTITTLGPVGFNPTGDYDSTRQYEKLDVVYYQGSSYVAIADSLGQVPTNAQYWDCIALGTLKQFIYDNVASMKLDNSLEDGKVVETIGYYSANDGGGATYKVRTKTVSDVVDEMFIIALADNTIVAELIIEDELNTLQLGGNNVDDSSNLLQSAINKCKKLNIDTNLKISSAIIINNYIEIDGQGNTIQFNNTVENGFTLNNKCIIKNLNINNNNYCKTAILIKSDNIIIDKCEIYNANETVHGGMGINIDNCDNIIIRNNYIHDIVSNDNGNMAGDALTLSSNTSPCLNILIENNHFKNCGRHNMSLWGWGLSNNEQYGIKISNNIFENSYLSGIDIEAGENVLIDKNTFINNGNNDNPASVLASGIALKTENNKYTNNIIISNNHFKNSQHACIHVAPFSNRVIIESNIMEDSNRGVKTYEGNGSLNININNNIFKNITNVFAVYSSEDQKFIICSNKVIGSTLLFEGSNIKNSIISNNIIDCDYINEYCGFARSSFINNNINLIKFSSNAFLSGHIRIIGNYFEGKETSSGNFLTLRNDQNNNNIIITNNELNSKCEHFIYSNGYTDENAPSQLTNVIYDNNILNVISE